MKIFQASDKDISVLQKISKTTFMETFSIENSLENMQQYIEINFSKNQLLSELKSQTSFFYLVSDKQQVVAYLKVNKGAAQTESVLQNALEIERIYVLQAFQGKKIGQLLLQKAIDVAQQQRLKYIWLGVWEHNNKAIAFYQKNGFEVFDRHVFVLGEDHQIDLLMKLHLHQ